MRVGSGLVEEQRGRECLTSRCRRAAPRPARGVALLSPLLPLLLLLLAGRRADAAATDGVVKVGDKEIPWKVNLPSGGGPFTTALVLTHGARGDLDALRLPLYAAAAADAGVPCLRVTLHMRDITARAMAMEGVMLKAAQLHPALKDGRRWVAGGHSAGARAAARVAAAVNGAARGPAGADDAAKALRGAGHRVTGLLLSSFPAHAPGRPDELYDRLLVGLKLPMLFFRGTRDNSSTQDAWERLRARLQTKDIEVAVVEGGDHMLRIAKGGAKQGAVDAQLSTALQAFLASHLKDSGGKGGDGGGSGGDEPGGGGPGGNGEVNVRRLRRARRAVH